MVLSERDGRGFLSFLGPLSGSGVPMPHNDPSTAFSSASTRIPFVSVVDRGGVVSKKLFDVCSRASRTGELLRSREAWLGQPNLVLVEL